MRMSAIIRENCELIAFLGDAIRDGSWQTPHILMIHPKEICCRAGSFGDILGKPGRKMRPSWHRFQGALYFQPRATASEKPPVTFPGIVTLTRPKHFAAYSLVCFSPHGILIIIPCSVLVSASKLGAL